MKKVKIFLLSVFFMCFSIQPVSDFIQNTLFVGVIGIVCYIAGKHYKANDLRCQVQIICKNSIIETENKETITVLEKTQKNILQAI